MKPRTLHRLAVALGAACAATAPLHADSLVAITLSNGDIDEYYVAKGTFNTTATWTKVRTIANVSGIFGITYKAADDSFYTTVVPAAAGSPRKITKVTRAGLVSDLAVRGSGTTGWTTGDPQGIEVGPDGNLYFSTAFGGGTNGNGVFGLNTSGGSFAQLIPVTGTGFNLANARDLLWSGSDLYVGSRNSNAVYRFNSSGVFQSALSTTVTGTSALGVDGTTMLVATNQNPPGSLRKIDNFATAPVLGTLSTTGKPPIEIGMVEGQRHYLYFGGANVAAEMTRLNADGSSTIMVSFATPTVRQANDFVVYLDTDGDGDGLPDSWEIAKLGGLSQGASDNTDGDALTNLQEYLAGTNPASPDTDGDGISDSDEANRLVSGSPAPTNPTLADTDGDGLTDDVETNTGNYISLSNTGTNPLSADSDGDTFGDYVEIARSSNPLLAASTPGTSAPAPVIGLDASALTAGPLSSWTNGGTIGSSFTVETPNSPQVQTVQGVKGVTFSGTEVMKGMAAPPVLTGNSSRTITAWVFNPTVANEETIFTWGRRDGGNGTNASFLHGTSTTFGAVGQWGNDADMPWGDDAGSISQNVKAGRWTFLAYTYDAAAPRLGTTYVDGVQVHQETFAAILNTWAVDNTQAARPLPFRLAGNNAANGSISTTGGLNASLTVARLQVLDRALTSTELGITDGDGDGIPAWWETFYGLGDTNAADAALDADGDGSTNLQEFQHGTSPLLGDTDGDGLSDKVETNTGIFISATDTGTDPLLADSDGDGLSDGVETNTGTFVSVTNTGTSPLNPDTDVDGIDDGKEVLTYQTNPFVDADKDGDTLRDADEVNFYLTNPSLADTDGDTFNDSAEIDAGSDPLAALSTPNDIPGYSGTLVHQFKLDETSGTQAADFLSPVTGEIGQDVTLGLSGRVGTSFGFPVTGTANSKVLIPTSVVPTGGNPFTMSAWVKLAAPLTNGSQAHIISGNNGEAGRWNLGINDFDASANVDARLFWFHNGGVVTTDLGATFNFNDHVGEWVHVAVTRSANGTTAIYINGVGGDLGVSKATLNPGVGLAIGERPNATQFQFGGNIDDVRFYDGGLSPANVLALYQSYPPLDNYATWAAGFGLDPESPAGSPAGDADGDGTVNAAEFALGLSPVDGTKRFSITTSGSASTGLVLSWPSAEGISFAVKSSTDLANWSTTETTVIGQAGQTTATWTAPAAAGVRKFYRVEFTP